MNKIHSHSISWQHLESLLTPIVLGVLMLVAGCSFLKPAESQSRYYLLTSVRQPAITGATNQPARSCVVRLMPVELAEYLQTKDMAVRSGTNEITFALFHRWAEPLDSGIRRVLAEDLRAMPEIREVLTDQPAPPHDAVYTLAVRVLACEGRISNQQGASAFEAAWEISGPAPRDTGIAHGLFHAKPATWTRGDYGKLAGQLSQAIGEFSEVLNHALSRKVNGSAP